MNLPILELFRKRICPNCKSSKIKKFKLLNKYLWDCVDCHRTFSDSEVIKFSEERG